MRLETPEGVRAVSNFCHYGQHDFCEGVTTNAGWRSGRPWHQVPCECACHSAKPPQPL